MGALPTAEQLPAALVTREQWVVWRTQDRNGKQTKVPVDPATGNFASATSADTWSDFATAREYAADRELGIGFVFTESDPVVGVDLDHCRDPDDGSWADWATDIVDRLDSYTEVSPSGTGLHVLLEGALPGDRNRSGDVECYDQARFFTVTGDHVDGTPTTLARRQDALSAVHAEYVAADDGGDDADDGGGDGDDADDGGAERETGTAVGQQSAGSESAPAAGNELDDDAVLARARDAANGEKFDRLWRGHTGGYPSQSEADMALCSLLAFWTGGDADQMDRLFRESGLMREKWDEVHFADGATYGERTIERAIDGSDEYYSPPGTTDASAGPSGDAAATAAPADDDDANVATNAVTARADAADGATSGLAALRSDAKEAAARVDDGAAGQRAAAAEGAAATVRDGETVVPKRVVEDLSETVQELQRETESLREELAQRDARIEELEAELEAERESGWLDRLFGTSG